MLISDCVPLKTRVLPALYEASPALLPSASVPWPTLSDSESVSSESPGARLAVIPLMVSGVFSVVVRLSCVPAPLFQLLAIWPNESAWFQMPTLSIRPLTVKFLTSLALRAPISSGLEDGVTVAPTSLAKARGLPSRNSSNVLPLFSTANSCHTSFEIDTGALILKPFQ